MSASENLSEHQFPEQVFREQVFRYAVDYAPDHDEMSAGRSKTTYVSVMAKNETEANLTAAQMASRHGIATGTRKLP